MNRRMSKIRLIGSIGSFLLIAMALSEACYCQTGGAALLLQTSPAGGGKTNLGAGVHHFEANTEVNLVATPKPGYRFVCWLGDVSDPATCRTVASLDGAKIVIAVFERVGEEFAVAAGAAGSEVGEVLYPAGADYARSLPSSAGGRKRRRGYRVWSRPPDSAPPAEPVPEPGTVVLLALGGLMLTHRKRV